MWSDLSSSNLNALALPGLEKFDSFHLYLGALALISPFRLDVCSVSAAQCECVHACAQAPPRSSQMENPLIYLKTPLTYKHTSSNMFAKIISF